MTETQLIQGCLTHNRTAQRLLYDRYKRAMYSLAYEITSDFDMANDVLQDTFLDVFKHIGQFRGEATLGAWIKKILVRKAYQKTKKSSFVVYQESIDEEAVSIDWTNEQIDNEQLEALILSLPDSSRAVFVLTEIEGYTHKEVAEMLNINEGTSKSQLFYAKKKLKEKINAKIA